MDIQIRPLHNRVLVKVTPNREMPRTKAGLFLPDSVKESPVLIGTVISVGPGEYVEGGMFVTPTVNVGDKVLFGQYAGANIDEPMGFEDFMLVRDPDILAVIETTTPNVFADEFLEKEKLHKDRQTIEYDSSENQKTNEELKETKEESQV